MEYEGRTYGEDVGNPENRNDDSGRYDNLPKGHAERLLACSFFVEVSEDVYAEDYH